MKLHSSGHSARGHPLAPLRGQLRALGLPDARTVATQRHGRRIRYAGLVICRQHFGTAGGVTFTENRDVKDDEIITQEFKQRLRMLVRELTGYGRQLAGQSDEPAGGEDEADIDLGPGMRREVDRHKRTEPGLNVGVGPAASDQQCPPRTTDLGCVVSATTRNSLSLVGRGLG